MNLFKRVTISVFFSIGLIGQSLLQKSVGTLHVDHQKS